MSEPSDDAEALARLDAETRAVEKAMQEAVNEAIRIHKCLGLPMVEWIDGKIVWTPSDQLVVYDSQAGDKPTRRYDKQLREMSLQAVLEKCRLDQALNAKEFAICAGISYSTARNWFRLPGFPAFHGVVFWSDFAQWRTIQVSVNKSTPSQDDRKEILEMVRIIEEGGSLAGYPNKRSRRASASKKDSAS